VQDAEGSAWWSAAVEIPEPMLLLLLMQSLSRLHSHMRQHGLLQYVVVSLGYACYAEHEGLQKRMATRVGMQWWSILGLDHRVSHAVGI